MGYQLGDTSYEKPMPVVMSVPDIAYIVAGADTGTAAVATRDIPGADNILPERKFIGSAAISVAMAQTAGGGACTVRAIITWVPGKDGTLSRVVSAVNLVLVGAQVSNTQQTIVVPVYLAVGKTFGKFQVEVVVTGSPASLAWDAIVTGIGVGEK